MGASFIRDGIPYLNDREERELRSQIGSSVVSQGVEKRAMALEDLDLIRDKGEYKHKEFVLNFLLIAYSRPIQTGKHIHYLQSDFTNGSLDVLGNLLVAMLLCKNQWGVPIMISRVWVIQPFADEAGNL